MASLKQLHELLHSLDKQEKKHLSVMVQAIGGKARARYAQAIKIINAQKEFDTDALKKKLSSHVSGMNLSEANNNLYEFVCRALTTYQSGSATTYANQLKLVEFFLQKKLFESAHKVLQKVIPSLEDNASIATLLRAHELQEVLTINYAPVNNDYNFRVKFFEQRLKAADMNRQNIDYLFLLFRYFELVKKIGEPRTAAQAKLYEEIWNDPRVHVPVESIYNRTLKIFYSLRGGLMIVLNMPDVNEKIRNQLHHFRTKVTGTIGAMGEMALISSLLWSMLRQSKINWQELQEIKKQTNEIKRNVPLVSIHERAKAQLITLELAYYIRESKFTEGIRHFENCMQPEERNQWKDALQSYEIPYAGARLYYLNNDPNKALDYLLAIQSQEKIMRTPFLISYRFLFLLCYYKLNNHSLVTSTADSIYKSLLKQEKLYAPEKALLRFVKSSGTIQKMKDNMKALHQTYLDLSKDPLNLSFFLYGDYLEWLKMELGKQK